MKHMDKIVFGRRNKVPYDEYQEIYKQTGLDIDDRLPFIQKMIPIIEKSIEFFVNLAKKVPGFLDVDSADQNLLLKGILFI